MAETIFEEGVDGFHSEQNWQDVKWLPEKEQVTKLNSDAVVDAQCALKWEETKLDCKTEAKPCQDDS